MDRITKLIQAVTRVIGIAFARLPSRRRPPELLAHPWFATVALLAANAALVAIVMRAPAGVGAQLGPGGSSLQSVLRGVRRRPALARVGRIQGNANGQSRH